MRSFSKIVLLIALVFVGSLAPIIKTSIKSLYVFQEQTCSYQHIDKINNSYPLDSSLSEDLFDSDFDFDDDSVDVSNNHHNSICYSSVSKPALSCLLHLSTDRNPFHSKLICCLPFLGVFRI